MGGGRGGRGVHLARGVLVPRLAPLAPPHAAVAARAVRAEAGDLVEGAPAVLAHVLAVLVPRRRPGVAGAEALRARRAERGGAVGADALVLALVARAVAPAAPPRATVAEAAVPAERPHAGEGLLTRVAHVLALVVLRRGGKRANADDAHARARASARAHAHVQAPTRAPGPEHAVGSGADLGGHAIVAGAVAGAACRAQRLLSARAVGLVVGLVLAASAPLARPHVRALTRWREGLIWSAAREQEMIKGHHTSQKRAWPKSSGRDA